MAKRRRNSRNVAEPRSTSALVLNEAAPSASRWQTTGVALLLAIATFAAYARVLRNEFVYLDDRTYVTENAAIQEGLTWNGVVWAFSTTRGANWHPLTWVSHMLDCDLFGLNPTGHHLTSVLLHVLNVILLFHVLRRMTGAIRPSAFVAAAFALHPAHVESVAWIAERKDVLSTFFGLLTAVAYIRYVERRTILRYAAVVGLFAVGLTAKPMLVTLPFVFLLLDYWPLGRLQRGDNSPLKNAPASRSNVASPLVGDAERHLAPPTRGDAKLFQRAANVRRETTMRLASLVAEKLPLLILAGVSSAITVYAQRAGGAMMTETMLSFEVRVANAVVSCAKYLAIAFWPSGLAVYYPHALKADSIVEVASAAAILVAVTLAVIAAARKHPHLLVGWFWFVGTLVPVIGLVQVGGQALADRYTYVPFIGLFIAVAWGVRAIVGSEPGAQATGGQCRGHGARQTTPPRAGAWGSDDRAAVHPEPGAQATGGSLSVVVARAAAVGVLLIFAATTWDQTGYWRDSKTLFQHALDVVPDNTQAHIFMAQTLVREGRIADAVPHFAEAVRIVPNEPYNLADYGRALFESGRIDEAAPQLEQAVKLMPTHSGAQYFLGVVRGKQNRPKEAIAHLQEALRLDPKLLHAHHYIGSAAADQRQFVQAIQHLLKWLAIDPKSSETLVKLGQCYSALGNVDAARETLQKAVDANPNDAYALAALAQIVSWQGDAATAIELYERALKIAPDYLHAANNLAMIYATVDDAQFRNAARAVELAEHSCRLTGYKDAVSLDTLAASYAEAGRFDDATRIISSAIEVAKASGEDQLVRHLEQRRAIYAAGRPWSAGEPRNDP